MNFLHCIKDFLSLFDFSNNICYDPTFHRIFKSFHHLCSENYRVYFSYFERFYEHGTPRSAEIQKKMPCFGTHIFLSVIPQGSQKCPFGNILCVSSREIFIFLIYVLENDMNLTEKGTSSAFN